MVILESCPFCGSQHVESSEVDINGWMVECMDCHATGPIGRTKALSVTAWCRRHLKATVDSQSVATAA
jgi:Lar family restriction alleviation protein